MANEFPEATARPRYRVTNLYDRNYLIDQNSVVLLQEDRPPTVADMEGVAKRYNQLDALRAAAGAAIKAGEFSLSTPGFIRGRDELEAVVDQLRAALQPQPEEGKS